MDTDGEISGLLFGQADGRIDETMKLLIQEYGRMIVTVIAAVLMLCVLGSGFLVVWRENGSVDDSIKTNFLSNEVKRTPPVLTVTDFKIRSGERADFSRHVFAYDLDGRDITSEVRAVRENGTQEDVSGEKQNLFQKFGTTEWKTEGIRSLKAMGFKTAAMALKEDSFDIDDPHLMAEEKLAVVLGTEGDGLASETIADCDYTVCIPMAHGVDSLNVAAASAVAFWQLGKH